MGRRRKIKSPPLGWRSKGREDSTRRGRASNEAGGRGQMPGSVEDLWASMEQPELNTGKRQSEAVSIANLRVNMGRAMEEMRANSLNSQGLFGEAIRAADEVISKYGPRTMPLMAKADALFRLGRQDEALAVSEQQMRGEDQIRYQHADMLYNMGRIGELDRFCDGWEARSDTDDPYPVDQPGPAAHRSASLGSHHPTERSRSPCKVRDRLAVRGQVEPNILAPNRT